MKNKIFKLGLTYLVLALGMSLFVACTPQPEGAKPSPSQITDQLGRVVALDKVPQWIISLAPSNTEILFALGLADKVVAVTDFCNYPVEAEAKPSIGGFSTPNIEEIVALSPDLLLATSIHEKKVIPQLENKGLTVLVLNPRTIDAVLEAINLVGKTAGAEAEASTLVAEMRQRIRAVTDKTASLSEEQRLRTFYVLWHDPLMTAGADTLQDELIRKAGGTNIAGELTRYADIGLEVVLAADPEVMIAGAGHGSGASLTFQFAQNESRLKDVAARRNNRLYAIDSDLAGRPGPRIVDALEQFAKFIHPELFR